MSSFRQAVEQGRIHCEWCRRYGCPRSDTLWNKRQSVIYGHPPAGCRRSRAVRMSPQDTEKPTKGAHDGNFVVVFSGSVKQPTSCEKAMTVPVAVNAASDSLASHFQRSKYKRLWVSVEECQESKCPVIEARQTFVAEVRVDVGFLFRADRVVNGKLGGGRAYRIL